MFGRRPLIAVGDRQLKQLVGHAIGLPSDHHDAHPVFRSAMPPATSRRRLIILSSRLLSRYNARHPARLRVLKRRACLIVIIREQDAGEILQAIRMADGLVFREINLDRLRLIAELAESGYVAIPSSLAAQLMNKGLRRELLQLLNAPEHRVLSMLSSGSSNRTIGEALGLDEGRTKYLIRSVFKKLHLENRTQAAMFALDVLVNTSTLRTQALSRPNTGQSLGQPLGELCS